MSIGFASIFEEFFDALQCFLWIAQFALPDDHCGPSEIGELFDTSLVPFDVGCELGSPIILARLGEAALRAAMTMPKAAVNENRFAATRECYVGFAREVSGMDAVSVAGLVQESTEEQFGTCVLRPNRTHDSGALFGSSGVGHALR
jgi:hypothetical protein